METRVVTLMVRYKGAGGKWKRSPAARGGNGRVKPGHALVDGKAVEVNGAVYELRLYEDRQAKYIPAGKHAADADAQRAQREYTATATAVAEDAGLQIVAPTERKTLRETAAAYIRDAEQRDATEAAMQARNVTGEFMKLVKRTYIDELTRDDIFRFHTALKKRGCEARTISNKHARLASWLHFAGVDKGIAKNDPNIIIPPKPGYEFKLPSIYTSEQTRTALAAADPYNRMLILLALKTGLRDRELMHLEFLDIDRADSTLTVRSKSHWGFHIKTWEQREIPLPANVLSELLDWEKTRPGQTLVLGTRSRRPNGKLLQSLKRLAKRAGLNCGRCEACATRNECEDWTLHKFRRTYITTLLRNGIDLRTVQAYAGHKDLASTMRYLRPAAGTEAQARLNAVQW